MNKFSLPSRFAGVAGIKRPFLFCNFKLVALCSVELHTWAKAVRRTIAPMNWGIRPDTPDLSP